MLDLNPLIISLKQIEQYKNANNQTPNGIVSVTHIHRYDMYFESRDPVPINSNPQLTFKDETDINKRDQAARAGGLISSSVAFFRTLRDGHLEPEIFHTNAARSKTPLFEAVVPWVPEQLSWYAGYLCGAYALDMSQHERLFNLTRYVDMALQAAQPCGDQLYNTDVIVATVPFSRQGLSISSLLINCWGKIESV